MHSLVANNLCFITVNTEFELLCSIVHPNMSISALTPSTAGATRHVPKPERPLQMVILQDMLPESGSAKEGPAFAQNNPR